MTTLGYDDETGLLPVLDDPKQDSLLKQWHEYRVAMDNTTPRPAQLDFGGRSVTEVDAGTADVAVAVTAI